MELIETSGHVPGHQAVLVRLPQSGPVLLTIDAAVKEVDLNPDTRPIALPTWTLTPPVKVRASCSNS